jgi:hypothetical protein
MVKSNNVRLIIDNQSGIPMIYEGDWFDHGRLADSYHDWSNEIKNEDKMDRLCYEVDYSWAGCSGYVQYKMSKTVVTFAFSNPFWGTNKLGVGTSGKAVWDSIPDHNHSSFHEKLFIGDVELMCM